jgi:hypothetical protein
MRRITLARSTAAALFLTAQARAEVWGADDGAHAVGRQMANIGSPTSPEDIARLVGANNAICRPDGGDQECIVGTTYPDGSVLWVTLIQVTPPGGLPFSCWAIRSVGENPPGSARAPHWH